MKRLGIHIIAMVAFITSCVTPGEIDILRDRTWSVFGLLGADKAPVVFVYALSEIGGYVYNSGAEIILEDLQTDALIPLTLVIATDEAFLGTREFPFDQDWTGKIYYYSTADLAPLPVSDYKVHIRLKDEVGIAEISFPEAEDFNNVEIRQQQNQDGSMVDRLIMNLPIPDADQLIKYEILIDQQIDLLTPIEFDTISGDPMVYDTLSFPFLVEVTSNNYLTRGQVIEKEGEFTYNLTNNLPAYANNQDPYLLNVRLRNYSEALVTYFESVSEQDNGSVFDPFVEPNIIESNIDGLLGVIGTYSYSEELILEYQR